jgi:hypothetical protein
VSDMSDDKPSYVDRVRANTRACLEDIQAENARLRADLDRAETAMRRFEQRFVEVEQENSNLAALYAASYQLQASLCRAEVLGTIQEIVINLIGSEEMAILRLGPGNDTLEPLSMIGLDSERLAHLSTRHGMVGKALAAGTPQAETTPADDGLTACIPLVVGGRALAIVAIFRLLPQKVALAAVDLELFALLGRHAATALYCAELHERHAEGEGS